ncbi:MAG: hypothetical protein WBC22_17635 [Sedimentisphaerales bacterium]
MAGFTRKMILVCVLALLASPMQSALAAEPNTIEIDVFDNCVYLQDLTSPMGTEALRMTGQVTVHVFFEGSEEGLADDDDGDSLDEVDTEIVELSLSGYSMMNGPVHMRLRTGLQSVGQMEETTDSNTGVLDVPPFGIGTVGSFFDIYFEFEMLGQRFYNIAALHWEGLLSEKPAGRLDTYVNSESIRLFDGAGNPTPLFFEAGRFRPNPPVEIDVFDTPLCELEIGDPGGQVFKVPMVGRTVERVFFEGAHEGTAYDDDGNLLDEVQTEMMELNFSGYDSYLGPVLMRLNANIPSMGEMEERTDYNTGILDVPPFFKDGVVDSFFNISFEIEMLGQVRYSQLPLRWIGSLWHKPAGPLTVYENLVDVDLVDAGGNPTGFMIGLTQYRPNPFIEVDLFDTSIASIELETPKGEQLSVELMGTSTINVFFEKDFEGSADDDDNDSLDEVVTELVQLDLSGTIPKIGDVHLGLDTRMPTLGQIEEDADDKTGRLDIPPFVSCGTAQSFFDSHFEIEIDGIPMYPERVPRWQAVIKEKSVAPGDVYEYLEGIRLVDSDGVLTDYILMTVRFVPEACGGPGHPYPPGDANLDCRVNLLDVAIVGLHWLECTRPECN